ncbi:hypothetical protein MICA_1108 [Micavibrio aeruginosavorus ARL-13]|uniref:Uncharacterized protein n=1 Tax=Micavibrio aeruginosavorus (strain ARL-13) TaxID=856793 RepID=G2KNA3_MICAA|nr:hypothetical protein MICA_1108 [Micavibrio aeruginosavorus ARL-13]
MELQNLNGPNHLVSGRFIFFFPTLPVLMFNPPMQNATAPHSAIRRARRTNRPLLAQGVADRAVQA